MRHVVASDLSVVVGEAIRKRLRFRQQQQAHVFVGVAREQHDIGGLEVFDAVLEIRDAGRAPGLFVHVDARHMGTRHHREPFRFERFRYRRDMRPVLRVDVAPAARAKAVIDARRTLVVHDGIDQRSAGERSPAELLRSAGHVLGELGQAQRRHRVFAAARRPRRCSRADRSSI